MSSLSSRHSELLARTRLVASRALWSAYPQSPSPKIHGEEARSRAEADFAALQGKPFALPGDPATRWVGAEQSPWGGSLNVVYPARGANPAGNACLTDAAYVANRFRVVACRAPAQ
jgi:hypothetical protein